MFSPHNEGPQRDPPSEGSEPSWRLTFPENRAARSAAQRVLDGLTGGRAETSPLLFVHGPAGSGKSHLMALLVAEVIRQAPDRSACVLLAGDLAALLQAEEAPADLVAARQAGPLILEALQHLPARAAEGLG